MLVNDDDEDIGFIIVYKLKENSYEGLEMLCQLRSVIIIHMVGFEKSVVNIFQIVCFERSIVILD
jgi:hypothetical protein